MAEADVSKMPNGDQLNGDHSQVKGNKMATTAAAAASGGPESTQCRVCSKRVYEMEKLVADNMVYHKTCFKCCKCTRTLRVGNYASMDAQIFCKPHFIECFKQKGNYEEGFGKERHKNKWLKSEDNSENEADDQAAGPSHSAKKSRPVAVDEQISVSAAAKPCHSAPPAPAATTVSSATAASGADLIDGDGAAGTVADDSAATVAASSKSKGEPVAISVSEKKSKFFQAVAESAKPKEHKPEPGKLRSDAWSGSSAAAQPSASTQRLAADGLGLGKSPGIGDKKSLFEAAAASGGGSGTAPAAAQPPPKSGVALRPRHESPGGSSESWRRSASVDDYDGRWSLSSTTASTGGKAAGEEATLASGERQSRSTTRAPPPVGRKVPADGAAELSGSVEQKCRAFQLHKNTDSALVAGERHTTSVAPAGGSPLKHKIEEFELHSGKHTEPPPAPHSASSESKEPAAAEEEASDVGGDVVVSSSRAEQLECLPPSADNDPTQQHHGQPLAAVPEAGEETAAAAAVGDKSLGRGGSGAGSIAGEQSSLAIDVGEDECFDKLGASAAEPFVREVASIKSKFEPGSEADSKPDSTYRSAAREEIDVIRGASAGSGGARSRYERALEETSRKQPPKTVGGSVELAPDGEAAAAAAPSADKPVVVEVASLKSRFESSGAEVASRDEPPPRLTSTSGTARQRYQKALEESTAKPVPKTGLTDVPVKVSCSAAASIGADDDDGAASAAAVQAAADDVEKPAAESSKPNDSEFQSVAISSLKSKFEAGGDAAEQSPRATAAAAAALDLGESPLQGGSVLARYQRALEESSSKPVAKAEVSPLPTRSLSVRVRPTGSTDATDGKAAAASLAVGAAAGGGVGELVPTTAAAAGAVSERLRSPQKTAMSSQHASTAKEAACADLDATASGAAPQEAAPPCKEDACGAKEPGVRVSPGPPAVPQKPSNARRPVDIQLQVKDDTDTAAAAPAAVKSPSALSPISPSAPTGSSQLHRIMNKFQSNADAQPAAQAHGSRPEPKPLKMPLFEGRRVPADGGDSKDHATSVAPLPFLTKNTKSLKERFEAQEQPQSGGRGLVADQKRRAPGPSSDDGAHATAHGGGGGAPSEDDVESVAAASSSIYPID